MADQIPLHSIGPDGAASGNVPTWNSTTGHWEPAAPSGVPSSRTINTDGTLTGGGNLSADRTLGVDLTAEAERIRDIIGAALVAGSNVTVTVNDAGDTITIAATSGLDAEGVRDTIGAALVAGTGITITVNDGADTITIAATGGGGSLTVQDENANVSTSVTQMDFQGAGVTVTAGTGEVIVTIPGGSGSSVGSTLYLFNNTV